MSWDISGRCLDLVTEKTTRWTYSLAPLAEGISLAGEAFRGRPLLTARIKESFERSLARAALSSAMDRRACLAHFWRFLDDQERISKIVHGLEAVTIDDLSWEELEGCWRHFIDWLRAKPPSEMSQSYKYKISWSACYVFLQAFELDFERKKTNKEVLNLYTYFKNTPEEMYDIEHVEFDDAKWGFRQLALAWRGILKRIEIGRSLASQGEDYIAGSSGANRWTGGYWKRVENRLSFLLMETPFHSIAHDPEKFKQQRSSRLRFDLPTELIWADGFYENATFDAHVASVFLRAPEIAVALAMVTMKTGLNVDTIARMRVDKWFRPDPFSPGRRVILHGPKRDGKRRVRASSSRTKHTDAYKIIERVIEIQAPLRKRMEEVAALTGDREMARRAKLIWVYPTQLGVKDILPGKYRDELNAWLDTFLNARAAEEERPEFRYRFSDGRDVWALFVYFRSGFNHVLTMQALGHSTIAALLHYLEKKVVIIEESKKLIDLQDRVIVNLRASKFDPARHRPERMHESISGLLCSTPTQPDQGADPGNPGGRICSTQRCFACSKWYATKESLTMLSRVIMDLERLRDDIAASIWETSEYPIALAVYLHIRSKFHRTLIAKAIEEAQHLPAVIQTGMFVSFAGTVRA